MSALTLAVFLLAQAAPQAAPGTQVRAVTVTFLDEKGAEVANLHANDVALLENGVARDITSFAPDRRPLSVAIVVDSSQPMGSAYRLNVVEAVSAFVSRLPEGARYSLWTTGDRPTKVLDFTDDRGAAAAALKRVAPQGGNYVLDAVGEVSEALRKDAREGDRTAMVIVTGTGPELSYRDQYRAAEEGERGPELFLAVQIDGGGESGDFETRSRLSYVFDRVARATGGLHEVVLSAMSVDTALRKLSPLLNAGYRLAYATSSDLKKRKLELKVARPGTKALLPAASAAQP
jgi:VWFA-related protein